MDEKLPLISVIVPVYNGQDYLENCIESIESQTYDNLEIIVVNDGSLDATDVVCDRLRESYDNVHVFTLDDKGVSAARNTGLKAAQGELITFVDADDRLRPGMLRTLYDCMETCGSDVAGCGFFLWHSEEEWADRSAAEETEAQIQVYEPDTYLREAILCGNSRCWSKLYRRHVMERVHFQEGLTIGEDMLLLIKMLPWVHKIAETEYPGYGYYQNPAGAINRKFTPAYMDQITCWQLAREEILRMDRSLDAQVCVHYVMGIMLTAGKLAMLPWEERGGFREYARVCHERLRGVLRVSGTFGRLSAGYRVKAAFFLLFPDLYLYLYGLRKQT